MGKEGYSREGFFGEIIHYDSKGNKIGVSRPGLFGDTYNNYDAKGNKIGETRPGFFGEYNTYDNSGHKIGTSSPGFLGTNHYDTNGHKTGSSNPGFLGTNTFGSGCSNAELIGKGIGAVAVEQDQARSTSTGIPASGGADFAGRSSSSSGSLQKRGQSASENPIEPEKRASPGLSGLNNEPPKKLVRYILAGIPNKAGFIYYLCDNPSVKVGDMVTTPDFEEKAEVLGVAECEEDSLPCLIIKRVIE